MGLEDLLERSREPRQFSCFGVKLIWAQCLQKGLTGGWDKKRPSYDGR